MILCFAIFPKRFVVAHASATVSEILIERDSKRVLYEANAHEKRGIASTTKILTAICAIENSKPDREVIVTDEMVGVEGSSIYLKAGEKLTVEELLYGLMLRSGNDAAVALAVAVSGSIEKFAELMNSTAEKIGAKESHFVNPHGLDDPDHYSTAYDLAIITAYALRNPLFAKIVDTERINVSNDFYDYDRVLLNKNKLLKKAEEYDGVKTGYTKKCGRCLVASKSVDGMQLIAVVLNCGPMFERCEELLGGGFDKYSNVKILDSSLEYGVAEVPLKKKITLPVSVKQDVYYPLTEEERAEISYSVENFKAGSDLDFNERAGKIDVYLKKDLIYSAESFIIIPQ